MKILSKIIYWLILGLLVLIAGLTALSAFKIPGNYQLLAVKSSSMSPVIQMGSVVIVKPDTEYKKGDVITFVDPDTPKSSVTHRVFEVKDDEGKISFITKGDANNSPDSGRVRKEQVLGKVALTLPYLGYPVSFAKTLPGLILLVIIPAVLIVGGELISIKKELVKMINKKKAGKKDD